MNRKRFVISVPWPTSPNQQSLYRWLPSRGNVLFTLFVIAALFWAQSVGAFPSSAPNAPTASTGTIAYQGRLADAGGMPLTGTYSMIFRLYDVAAGGTSLWTEQWTGPNNVQVSDGLFNVMLGSMTPLSQTMITSNSNLWLGITVGTDGEMLPRVQLGSVPFAMQALIVPDGSITQAKLAPDVNLLPPPGSITTTMLADGAVTTANLDLISGNVGIGTASPSVKLNVYANTARTNPVMFELNNADTTVGYNYGLWFRNRNTTNNNYTSITNLDANGNGNAWIDFINVDHTTPRGALAFLTRDGGTYSRRMYINETGNVGIGTTSPVAKLDIIGDLHATGTKSAVVQAGNYGQRTLYAIESPDVRFSDEGLAHLQGGSARVDLDLIFVETIEGDYLVQVTPYGDSSLYVAEIGHDYFVVKTRDGNPNVDFAWRLSAHRKGYAGKRLEEAK